MIHATDTFPGAPTDRAFGLQLHAPVSGFEGDSELLLIFNFSDRWIRIPLPGGDDRGWETIADSAELKATMDGSLYPPARGNSYEVSPFNIVWLRRSK
jgi:hypothetical protein